MAEAKFERDLERERPLSPHLQIYAPPINMVMSILHRLTGGALYVGLLVLAWWLVAAAAGPHYFDYVSGLLASWPGRIVLFGFTWALVNHLLGGLRHLVWDTGRGFDLATVDLLCWASLIASFVITLALWAYVFTSALGFDS